MRGVENELRKAAGQHDASWAWDSSYAARSDKFTVRIASQDLFASCEDAGFEKPECLGLHTSLFLTLGSSHAIDQVKAAIRSQPVVRHLPVYLIGAGSGQGPDVCWTTKSFEISCFRV